jgi:Sulfotransferase family
MPVIVGAPRSGTTLLRVMLDAHPDLAIPPETGFVLDASRLRGEGDSVRERLHETITRYHTWRAMGVSGSALADRLRRIEPFDVAEGVRAFYQLYAERFGKRRYGDKTPMYRFHLSELAGLLPEARFIHLIRDGRDVALSVRGFWFAPGDDVETIARDWCNGIAAARDQGSRVGGYIEVRFEDLILGPERELGRVCEFLDLELRPSMLRYHETASERLREIGLGKPGARNPVPRLAAEPPDPSRVARWRRDMTRREKRRFKRAAGDMLRELGYEA